MKELRSSILRCGLSAVVMLIVYSGSTSAQSTLEPSWHKGKATAVGTDFARMKEQALRAASLDALKQSGIVLKTMDIFVRGESNGSLSDFYSQFAESSTRGLILEERNVVVVGPTRVPSVEDQFRIEVSLEALVVVQNEEPDPGFEVVLRSDRESYEEDEPVALTITSTRGGFLTLFNVSNDSLSILLPNPITKENQISENSPVSFPPNDMYSLTMQVRQGQNHTDETFIAVVSRDDIPFSDIDLLRIERNAVTLKQDMRSAYTKWLFRIPPSRRSSDVKILRVVAKKK